MTETTMNTDDAAIALKMRDLVGPGANAEIVTDLLDHDHAAVAEAAMKLLHRLGSALRAAGVDPDAVLAADAKPRRASDRLAAALRRRPSGDGYQQGATS